MRNPQKIPCKIFRFCRTNPEQLELMMSEAESLHLTETELCAHSLSLIRAFVAGGGEIILDTNHLAAFMSKTPINYAEILQQQQTLVEKLPVATKVKVVAPYADGDFARTVELQHKYQLAMQQLAELGVSFILPIFLNKIENDEALAHIAWFKQEVGPAIMGIRPGGKPTELLEVLKESGCGRVHLMNAMTRPARALIDRIPHAIPDAPDISGSFNQDQA